MLNHKYRRWPLILCLLSSLSMANGKFDGSAGIEFGYDSDVAVDEIDLITAQSDRFVAAKLAIGYKNKFVEDHEIKLSYRLLSKNYQDNKQFNLLTHLASAGYDLKLNEVTLGVTYRYANSSLGSESFLQLSQLSPYLSWFLNKKNYMRFAYTFIDKTLQRNPIRDSNSNEFSGDYYYFFSGLNNYVILAVKLRDEDAQDDLFNFTSQQLRLAYQKRIELSGSPLKILLDWRLRRKDYGDKIHPLIDDYRLDQKQSVKLALKKTTWESWIWEWQLEYSDNDSNIPSVNFSQWQSTLGVAYSF